MPRVYKAITASLALAGCLSLIVSGELNPAFVLPGLAMLPGYYRFLLGAPPAPWWAIGGLSVLTLLVLGFDILVVRDDYFVAIAHMTIMFQAVKSFDLKTPWDTLQVFFMSLLQLIISSELSLSILFGGVFVVFLVILMVAIVFSHFVREGTAGRVRFRGPLAAVTVVVFVLTVLLFVAVPRVRGGYFGARHSQAIRSVGFTESVDLGSFGSVLLDETVVMRAEIEGPRLPLYWRGRTLDYFDGGAWRDTIEDTQPKWRRYGRPFVLRGDWATELGGTFTVQRIMVEPMDTRVLFTLGEVWRIDSPGYRIFVDGAGSVFMNEKSYRRVSYTVTSRPGLSVGIGGFHSKYLQLPGGMEFLDPLVGGMVSPGMTARQKAGAIERRLLTRYGYSLTVTAPPPGMTALEHFLLNERKGYCEHFASAMTLMLRKIGIPARLVTGFYGGDENDLGDYVIVRQSNAHSWVEAYIEGTWVRFDPTPLAPPVGKSALALSTDALRMAWYRYVIGFSKEDQASILRAVTASLGDVSLPGGVRIAVRPIYPAVAIAALGAAFLFSPVRRALARLLSAGPVRPESRIYRGWLRLLRKRGVRVGPAMTSREAREEALRLFGDREAVEEFVRLYEEARFGGGSAEEEMRRLLRSLRRDRS